jgi:3-deoxy-D-manno-octulosonate 8-phosphate phosphatase (KDO 8-P phosphatase)
VTLQSLNPKTFILDVDGVLTTGQFFYDRNGKAYKVFGPDDNDALALLRPFLEIRFITGDKKGFDISKRRIVDDMDYKLDLVSTVSRVDWIAERYDLRETIYMGDGIFDHLVMQKVGYSIAPANAYPHTRETAQFVTRFSGGDRAVAEGCLHLLEKFFTPFDLTVKPNAKQTLAGEVTV